MMAGIESIIEEIELLQSSQLFSECINLSEKMILEYPMNWLGYWYLGNSYKNVGDYAQAVIIYKKLEIKFPEQYQGLEGQLKICEIIADWNKAINISNEMIALFPQYWLGYWCLGQAYIHLNFYSHAEETFQTLKNVLPSMHTGIEGLLQVSQKEHDWEKTERLAQEMISNHGDNWQGYWYLGQANLGLGNYTEAESSFLSSLEKFPNNQQSYEGLLNIYLAKRKWHKVISISEKMIFHYPKFWLGHWNLGQAYIHLENYKKANIAFEKLKTVLPNVHVGIEGLLQVAEAESAWEKSITLSEEMVDKYPENWWGYWYLGQAYWSLKDTVNAEKIFNLMDEKFVNNTANFINWANNVRLESSAFRDIWFARLVRFNQIYLIKPNDLDIIVEYVKLLLSTEHFEKSEKIINHSLDIYPNAFELLKQKTILSHHKRQWEEVKSRFEDLIIKHPDTNDDTWFYYIRALSQLNLFDEFKAAYHLYNTKRYYSLPNKFLDDFQANLLLRNYDDLNRASCVSVGVDNNKLNNLLNVNTFKIEKFINNPSNEIMIISFVGYNYFPVEQFDADAFIKTQIFNKNARNSTHVWKGMAKYTKQFNFLLVNDYASSYFQFNFDEVYSRIIQEIESSHPKYIICIGSSAGGFASILFGQKLRADVVFSFMPRTQAFVYEGSKTYHRYLQESFKFFEPSYIDIGFLQYKWNGLIPKTYVVTCDNEPSDGLSVSNLDTNDENLSVSLLYGDHHAAIEYLGAKNVFNKITNYLEQESKNKFKLPLQRDLFSDFIGYKCNLN